MRLYNMYYVCKELKERVQDMQPKKKGNGSNPTYYIDNWIDSSLILNKLSQIAPLRGETTKLYETIPVMYRDKDSFDITESIRKTYTSILNRLLVRMQTIIDAYEVLNVKEIPDAQNGIDVKLPEFENISEFSKCLDDLNFVFTQCPYLQKEDGQIRYSSVDVGSAWLTFFAVGAGAATILSSLGKIVDTAVKIKSHVVTLRQQEEVLRSMQLKGDMAEEMVETYKKVNKELRKQYTDSLTDELGGLADGEEEGKLDKSLEKLAFWMDKGLQIYAAIDSPKEVKDLFPKQEDVSFLTDDIQKLIEMKKDE